MINDIQLDLRNRYTVVRMTHSIGYLLGIGIEIIKNNIYLTHNIIIANYEIYIRCKLDRIKCLSRKKHTGNIGTVKPWKVNYLLGRNIE